MNVNTELMDQYAEFLTETSARIITLCNEIENALSIAVQCMDSNSGRGAAARMSQNMEVIKANVPISEGASQRLVLSRRMVDNAGNVFGR